MEAIRQLEMWKQINVPCRRTATWVSTAQAKPNWNAMKFANADNLAN